MAEYEIAIKEAGKVKVIETREGPIPEEGEMVEVTLDGEDVELEVQAVEKVHKKIGVMNRVVIGKSSGSMMFLG